MFSDDNMFNLGITYLFGTTPLAMMCMQGEIAVNINERALEILKLKPMGQRLCVMPAELMMSDEQYYARLLVMHQKDFVNETNVDDLIGLIWKYMSSELEMQVCAGPFSVSANIKTNDDSLKDLIKLLA